MKRKTWVNAVIALFITLICLFAVGCSCNMGSVNNGTAPVYKGMTALSVPNADASFTDETKKEVYDAQTKRNIFIHIHIDNPDNYKVESFLLNGEKYTADMLESVSDGQTLILAINVGANLGIVEYTIDQIKYLRTGFVRDMAIKGDKTIKINVYSSNLVTAAVSKNIRFNDIQFDINVSDADSVIAFSKGNAGIRLYDGDTLLFTKTLQVGENSVVFDGLGTNKTYRYVVFAAYDNFVRGFKEYSLKEETIQTKAIVSFADVTVGKESASFRVVWDEDFTGNKQFTSLFLHQDGANAQVLDVSATEVNGLLSGKAYTLFGEYINNGKTETVSLDFTTHAKTNPVISIINVIVTRNSVSFGISERDQDNVAEITKIEIIHAELGTVEAENTDVREFTDLFSDYVYTLQLTYQYDLNDGMGVQTATVTKEFETERTVEPSIALKNTTKTNTSVAFTLEINDWHNVCEIKKIELIHEKDGTIVADNTDVRSFENLSSLVVSDCTVRVTYEYDANDGMGTREKIAEHLYYAGSVGLAYALTSTYNYRVTGIGTCMDAVIGIPDKYEGRSVVGIEANAFKNNKNLTGVIIGDKVSGIGDSAFASCSNLVNVEFGENVYSIGAKAFASCSKLRKMAIPDTVSSLGECVFEGAGIVDLVIGDGVVTIPKGAFNGCTALGRVVIGEKVTKISHSSGIGEDAFYNCMRLVEVYNKSALTIVAGSSDQGKIGEYADYVYTQESDSKAVTIVDDFVIYGGEHLVTYIGDGGEITIPSGVTVIGYHAFGSLSGITKVEIPSTVTRIEENAFYSCDDLTEIIIPEGVTYVGERAFRFCRNLTKAVIAKSVTKMQADVFEYCENVTIYCRASSKPSGWSNGWNPEKRPVVWGSSL